MLLLTMNPNVPTGIVFVQLAGVVRQKENGSYMKVLTMRSVGYLE